MNLMNWSKPVLVFRSIQKLILNTEDPIASAIKYGPYYLFMVGFLIALVTIKKGLKHIGLDIGVGFARGIGAIDLRVVGNIFMSWVVTLPAGAILSIVFFYTLKGIFG